MTENAVTYMRMYVSRSLRSEKDMATHSSILAWRIPWTEEAGGLLSIRSHRVGLKQLSMHACIGEGNGNPLQYSCLENPRDRGAWWAAVYGVAQSQTRLKQSSSSSKSLGVKAGKTWTDWRRWERGGSVFREGVNMRDWQRGPVSPSH